MKHFIPLWPLWPLWVLASFVSSAHALTITVEPVAQLPAGVHGLAVHPSGKLVYSDSFGSAGLFGWERPFDAKAPLPLPGNAFALPAGLLFMGKSLFVCDTKNGELVELDEAMKKSRVWPLSFPWNAVEGRPGELLIVSHGGLLSSFAPATGQSRAVAKGLLAPFDAAYETESDAFWVTEQGSGPGDPGRVARWKRGSDGLLELDLESNHAWKNPEGIRRLPDGSYLVAETEEGALVRVLTDGSTQVVETGLGIPIALARESDGRYLLSANVAGSSTGILYGVLAH
jgi:DNA-binding beta-propeller fold protein YncE